MAVTVKSEEPAVVGVPEIAPAALMVSSAGKLPLVTLRLMVPTPPVVCTLTLYAVPTKPLGSVVVVKVSLGLIVMLSSWLAVCGGMPESVAVTVKFDAPEVVGVPEMAPSAPKVNPPGKLPLVTLQLIVPVPPEDASEAL